MLHLPKNAKNSHFGHCLYNYETAVFRTQVHNSSETSNFFLIFSTLGFFSMLDLVVSLVF